MARGGAAGRERERRTAKRLEAEGWVVVKGTGYGAADLSAMRRGHVPLLVQCKSTADGPYKNFGPAERAELRQLAHAAGARAVLAWWPPNRQLELIPSHRWP